MKKKPTLEDQMYERLELARKLLHMTQGEVGAYMDEPLTQQGYSRAIRLRTLSVHQFLEIMKILGVTMEEICGKQY